jgi:hypothetical protein
MEYGEYGQVLAESVCVGDNVVVPAHDGSEMLGGYSSAKSQFSKCLKHSRIDSGIHA